MIDVLLLPSTGQRCCGASQNPLCCFRLISIQLELDCACPCTSSVITSRQSRHCGVSVLTGHRCRVFCGAPRRRGGRKRHHRRHQPPWCHQESQRLGVHHRAETYASPLCSECFTHMLSMINDEYHVPEFLVTSDGPFLGHLI